MMAMFALFVVGLGALIVGAEALVRGASRLAGMTGVPPLIIGLTVVAFGTSSPELAVSVRASLAGQADLSLGNVVGSNIFNVLFILGISAAISPLFVSRRLVRLDVPIMIGASALVLLAGWNGQIGRLEGLWFVVGLLGYTALQIGLGRKNQGGGTETGGGNPSNKSRPGLPWIVNPALIAGGLVLLVVGSRWLVAAAVAIAQALGISELIIGLTIVAAGTSMPELATSVVAAIRGERDIAIGNVVGSNIFNIFGVLGLAGLVGPDGIVVTPAALHFDIPVMIAVALACMPVFFTGGAIARWEGVLFFGYYLAYVGYLFLASTEHAVTQLYGRVMLVFVVPITFITLALMVARTVRSNRRRPA